MFALCGLLWNDCLFTYLQKVPTFLKFRFYLVEASFRLLALSFWTVGPTHVLPQIQREKLRKLLCFLFKVGIRVL